MAKQVQIRRGTMQENQEFTGAEGELTYNTEFKTVHVHDGVTMGGHPFLTPQIIQMMGGIGGGINQIVSADIDDVYTWFDQGKRFRWMSNSVSSLMINDVQARQRLNVTMETPTVFKIYRNRLGFGEQINLLATVTVQTNGSIHTELFNEFNQLNQRDIVFIEVDQSGDVSAPGDGDMMISFSVIPYIDQNV